MVGRSKYAANRELFLDLNGLTEIENRTMTQTFALGTRAEHMIECHFGITSIWLIRSNSRLCVATKCRTAGSIKVPE